VFPFSLPSFPLTLLTRPPKRVLKQLHNAQEKLERAQKHAEDKRLASQQTIERLQREYEEMALERRDNDEQMEKLRMEADDVAAKVLSFIAMAF
jgi:kinetochore protein Nuf2